jgi:phosphoribosylamine---glycine ligase
MKILLIGSGGREHSIALKLKESPRLLKLYIAPGNAGTAEIGTNIPISDSNIEELLNFALNEEIDLTIVGPEAPLVAGITDLFEQNNLKIVGPDKAGAQLEGSKKWAKDMMKSCGIPTAGYENFDSLEPAKEYLTKNNTYPIVIKADGLAAGKGVIIAQNETEAFDALDICFTKKQFGDAGSNIVIEDFLTGEEASILAFTDGKVIVPMVSAQDHKTVYDGDKGPNTGGMGAYSPAPIVTDKLSKKVYQNVFLPLLKGFKDAGITYKGIVYAGLMIENGEPYVIEFNARFGDPETQVVLPRLKTDLIDIFEAIADQRLDQINIEWKSDAAVCVILAAGGYPGSYEKGKEITGLELYETNPNIIPIHAGTKKTDANKIVTNGGRVLGVVSLNPDLQTSINEAYKAINNINFENKYFRTDIGAKALRHE